MAGDWIPMRLDLDEDPAVIAVARVLGVDCLVIVGRLWKLWAVISRQTDNGWLPHYGFDTLDSLLRLPGFSAALEAVGWLQQRSGGIEVPHFERWLSESAKKRFKDAERKKRERGCPDSVQKKVDKIGTPVLSSPLNNPPQKIQDGGMQGGCAETVVESFAETPEGIAQAWCFYLTRKRLGTPRDSPLDMAAEFGELIRLGTPAKRILESVVDKRRDRGEQFWEFRDRILGKKGKVPPAKPMTTDVERAAKASAQRKANEADAAARASSAEVKRLLATIGKEPSQNGEKKP